MHAIVNRPVVKNDKIVARPMMLIFKLKINFNYFFFITIIRYLALTYDHRLIDGREAVTFLKTIKEEIEDPTRILLDV
jgi:2-oxoglutarate dehydrogenase E2 component (dihydrolipoamide succinyltransferase)